MMHIRTIAVGMLFIVSPVFGSLYLWNPAHRPPVSLRQAVDTARRALQDEGQIQFCTAASLYGNKEGDGREGAWNLFFVMADGRVMHVYVDIDAQMEITTQEWEKPTDKLKLAPSRPANLKQAAERIREVLAVSSIDTAVTLQSGILAIDHGVRRFQVYPKGESGHYATILMEDTGPTRDGLWLRVMRADQQPGWTSIYDWRVSSGKQPYWYTRRHTFYLEDLTPVALELRTAWDNRRLYPFPGEVTQPEPRRELAKAILESLDVIEGWDSEKKPPISLLQALLSAEEAVAKLTPTPYTLGRFRLWGDPRPGMSAWHIEFVQGGVTPIYVAVQMDGRVEVKKKLADEFRNLYDIERWPRLIAKNIPTDTTTIDGVKERLNELFADADPPATIRLVDGSLTLAFRTRRFAVYGHAGEEFNDRLAVTVGPRKDGVWARIEPLSVDAPSSKQPSKSIVTPYWEEHSGILISTSDPDTLYRVTFRVGERARELAWKIIRVMGPRYDNGMFVR